MKINLPRPVVKLPNRINYALIRFAGRMHAKLDRFDRGKAVISVTFVTVMLAIAVMIAHVVGGGSNNINLNDHAAAIIIFLTALLLVLGQVVETNELTWPAVAFFLFLSGFALLYLRVWFTFEDRAWLQSTLALWTIRSLVEIGSVILFEISVYRLLTRGLSPRRAIKRLVVFAIALALCYLALWSKNGRATP